MQVYKDSPARIPNLVTDGKWYLPVGRLHCNSQEAALDTRVFMSLQLLCYGMSVRSFVESEKESLM